MIVIPFEGFGMSNRELDLWTACEHPDHLAVAIQRVRCHVVDGAEYDGYVIPLSEGRARGLESGYIAGWKVGCLAGLTVSEETGTRDDPHRRGFIG